MESQNIIFYQCNCLFTKDVRTCPAPTPVFCPLLPNKTHGPGQAVPSHPSPGFLAALLHLTPLHQCAEPWSMLVQALGGEQGCLGMEQGLLHHKKLPLPMLAIVQMQWKQVELSCNACSITPAFLHCLSALL